MIRDQEVKKNAKVDLWGTASPGGGGGKDKGPRRGIAVGGVVEILDKQHCGPWGLQQQERARWKVRLVTG